MAAPFRILTVCTGNVCRSPVAEFLLRHALGPGVEVASAGVAALVDAPVDPPMVDRLRTGGVVDTAGFRARRLTAAMIQEADLILAMTRDHRADVVTEVPQALGRTFTLTEYAAILARWADGRTFYTVRTSDRLAEFTAEAARLRGTVRFDAPAEYDVPDPFRAAPEVYDLAYDRIGAAVAAIAAVLRRDSGPGGTGVPGTAPRRAIEVEPDSMTAPSGEGPAARPRPEMPREPVAERSDSGQGGLRGLFRRHRP
ncbi:hypothetical protein [Raineyella sp. LH-20]|uniref:arsenate reductase/protein-tyrosine-phosphatase family protein n=1 Tax=Raineyella sp. LH-20 TaxID=3081204 RepID=UPI0029550036|nr:hypothetical protein [Raineyella sp. LH-20]WOP17620.1 hypothetical protein R0146_10120 [Raineyella sp. LH-20]